MPGSKPGLLLNTTNLDLLSEMAISFSYKVHSKNQFIQLPGISVTISLPSANKFIAPLLLRFVCRKLWANVFSDFQPVLWMIEVHGMIMLHRNSHNLKL